MRNIFSLVVLVILLGVTVPAQAQLRTQVGNQQSTAKLYGSEGTSFALNRLFSPEHFKMSHSYEMSFGSFGGNSSSLGMYTNTMMFQFNDKLAARVDLSFAHQPFGGSQQALLGENGNNGQFFLRNAEVAYRPSENVRLHLSVRQSPYGSYMSPYGRHGYGHYGMHSLYAGFGDRGGDLFWNDGLH